MPNTRSSDLAERGRRVLRLEAEAVLRAAERLDEAFAQAVALLKDAKGRIIVSGVGKSGIIARKIAATFTSTGTPAAFLHPIDSLHGDLGIVSGRDVAILLSNSGETEELFGLIQQLARLNVPIIALTGGAKSRLAQHSKIVLDAGVVEEACSITLAPTASTATAMALGDALAVALLEEKGFRHDQFRELHPGGAISRRPLLRVAEVMVTDDLPTLTANRSMQDCVILLARKRGTVAVVNEAGALEGVITAGDLTRLMNGSNEFLHQPVKAVMNRQPKTASADELAAAAMHRMEQYGIMALPVLDGGNKVVGMVHLHDLLRAGNA